MSQTNGQTRETAEPDKLPVGVDREPMGEVCRNCWGEFENIQTCDNTATHTLIFKRGPGDYHGVPFCNECGAPPDEFN